MKPTKLTSHTNPTLWTELTAHGAPRPADSSPLWNDWAGNNPQPEAIALAKVSVIENVMPLMKAIATGARPIEL